MSYDLGGAKDMTLLGSAWLPGFASVQPVSGGRFPVWLIVLVVIVALGIAGAFTLRDRGGGKIPLAPPDDALPPRDQTAPPESEPVQPDPEEGPDSTGPGEAKGAERAPE